MLSSLSAQTCPDLVHVDVAFMPNNGNPTTESVIELFKDKISLSQSLFDDYSIFQRRGLVRNHQLLGCKTEWLLFSDCDMVYHPEYLARLKAELSANHANASYLISSGRLSNPKEVATRLVDTAVGIEPIIIKDAFKQAQQLPNKRKRNAGGGFSQLINVKFAPHGSYYVDPEQNRDWTWDNRYQKARSDVQFRKRIGRIAGPRQRLPKWFSFGLIHLNHNRDKEFKYHLEEQR